MAEALGPVGRTDAADTAPPPTLLGPLLPHIEDLREALHRAVDELQLVPPWDGATEPHAPLVDSCAALRAVHGDWAKSIEARLTAAWLREVKHYNAYRALLERRLAQRHAAEWRHLFPALRLTPSERTAGSDEAVLAAAATVPDMAPRTVRDGATHCYQLGFRCDFAAPRPLALVGRQLREKGVLQKTVALHADRLHEAQEEDVGRLQRLLDKVLAELQATVRHVERKMQEASHATGAHAFTTR